MNLPPSFQRTTQKRELKELRRSASRERADFLSPQMKLQTKLTDARNQLRQEHGRRQGAENHKNIAEHKLSADAWLHLLFWDPCLLVWTFWFVIRLRIYEFGLWLGHHFHNYLEQKKNEKVGLVRKKENFQIKNYFSYFCSKHTLAVLKNTNNLCYVFEQK